MRDEDKKMVEKVVKHVIAQLRNNREPYLEVIVNTSARHVHLSQDHMEILFGKNYTLTPIRKLMQPGEFAAKETITIIGPEGVIQNVRVLGPLRNNTQVEISKTDGYILGIDVPLRESGNHNNTPGCVMAGPMGVVSLENGVICALRHIHMPEVLAKRWNLEDNQLVKVATHGERRVVFDKVQIRVSPEFVLEMHVDTDEANAAGIKNGDKVFLLAVKGDGVPKKVTMSTDISLETETNTRKITLDIAKAIIKAAECKAVAIGKPMAISVVDEGGHLVALRRMDGVIFASIDISINKAYTSVAFKSPTSDLNHLARPEGELYGLNTLDKRYVTFGGGLPILKDNDVIGAIGVSGGTIREDVVVAEAGLKILT